MTKISSESVIEKTKQLAMHDELFAPESISLEPGGNSLTVRLPDKVKRFSKKLVVTIPAWSEDIDLENECLVL